jgi:hypothetical protein
MAGCPKDPGDRSSLSGDLPSGPSSEQWRSHGVPRSLRLVKPFAPAQLVAALSTLLSVR